MESKTEENVEKEKRLVLNGWVEMINLECIEEG